MGYLCPILEIYSILFCHFEKDRNLLLNNALFYELKIEFDSFKGMIEDFID